MHNAINIISDLIMSSVSGLLYGFINRNNIIEWILIIVVLAGFIANIMLLIYNIAIHLLCKRSSFNNPTHLSAQAQEISSVNLVSEMIDTSSVIQESSKAEISMFSTYIDLETRRELEISRGGISKKEE